MSVLFKKSSLIVATVAAASFAATGAHAAGSLDSLIAGISFTDVIAAIMSIGVLVIGVDLAQLGYMRIRHMIKR